MRCRVAVALAFVLMCGACGSTTPDAPTAPSSQPASPSSPSPLLGDWIGSVGIDVLDPNGRLWHDGCDLRVHVASQSAGQFSGSYQAHGHGASDDRSCERAGEFSGAVADNGTISGFRFNTPSEAFGDTRQCTRVSGDGVYAGSSDGSSLTVQTSDRWSCSGGGVAIGRFSCVSDGPAIECSRSLRVSVARP